jgi:hypothetical protein
MSFLHSFEMVVSLKHITAEKFTHELLVMGRLFYFLRMTKRS